MGENKQYVGGCGETVILMIVTHSLLQSDLTAVKGDIH